MFSTCRCGYAKVSESVKFESAVTLCGLLVKLKCPEIEERFDFNVARWWWSNLPEESVNRKTVID